MCINISKYLMTHIVTILKQIAQVTIIKQKSRKNMNKKYVKKKIVTISVGPHFSTPAARR